MPFAAGTITAIDAVESMITLTPMFGNGAGQTVRATSATQITALTEAKIADLKVGEIIQVRGVPTGITAAKITAGNTIDSLMGGPFGGPSPGSMGGGAMGQGGSQSAFATATGKITGISPLTISVSDSLQATLKAAPDVKVSKNVTEKVSDLKVGDRVMANGQPSDNGVLTATQILVNADYVQGR